MFTILSKPFQSSVNTELLCAHRANDRTELLAVIWTLHLRVASKPAVDMQIIILVAGFDFLRGWIMVAGVLCSVPKIDRDAASLEIYLRTTSIELPVVESYTL